MIMDKQIAIKQWENRNEEAEKEAMQIQKISKKLGEIPVSDRKDNPLYNRYMKDIEGCTARRKRWEELIDSAREDIKDCIINEIAVKQEVKARIGEAIESTDFKRNIDVQLMGEKVLKFNEELEKVKLEKEQLLSRNKGLEKLGLDDKINENNERLVELEEEDKNLNSKKSELLEKISLYGLEFEKLEELYKNITKQIGNLKKEAIKYGIKSSELVTDGVKVEKEQASGELKNIISSIDKGKDETGEKDESKGKAGDKDEGKGKAGDKDEGKDKNEDKDESKGEAGDKGEGKGKNEDNGKDNKRDLPQIRIGRKVTIVDGAKTPEKIGGLRILSEKDCIKRYSKAIGCKLDEDFAEQILKIDPVLVNTLIDVLEKDDLQMAINNLTNNDIKAFKEMSKLNIVYDLEDLSKGAFLPWNKLRRETAKYGMEYAEKGLVGKLGEYEPNPIKKMFNKVKMKMLGNNSNVEKTEEAKESKSTMKEKVEKFKGKFKSEKQTEQPSKPSISKVLENVNERMASTEKEQEKD